MSFAVAFGSLARRSSLAPVSLSEQGPWLSDNVEPTYHRSQIFPEFAARCDGHGLDPSEQEHYLGIAYPISGTTFAHFLTRSLSL